MNALDALLSAKGNLKLAAERLSISETELVRALSNDPQALFNVIRTLLAVTLFQSLQNFSMLTTAQAMYMEPADLAGTYMSIAKQLAAITAQPAPTTITVTQNNVVDSVFNALPPDAQQALRIINARTSFKPKLASGYGAPSYEEQDYAENALA